MVIHVANGQQGGALAEGEASVLPVGILDDDMKKKNRKEKTERIN